MAEEPCDKAERDEDEDGTEGKREDEFEDVCKGELRGAAREVPDEAEAEDAVARADAGDKAEDEDAKERGVEGGHVVFSLVVKTNRALFLSLNHRFKEAFYLAAEVLDFCVGEAADLPVLSPADECKLVPAGDPHLFPHPSHKYGELENGDRIYCFYGRFLKFLRLMHSFFRKKNGDSNCCRV